jgi:ABC-type sugar transport system permease subunit
VIYAIDNTYSIVNSSGVQILIFLSALQSISPSIFESAKVEGATKWEEFWKITFPILTPMILVSTVYTIIDSFTNPRYRVLEYIRENAFASNRLGFASAMAWIFFLIIAVIIWMVFGLVSRRVHYLD